MLAYPIERGGNGPLRIPVGGLADGTSRIAAGKRAFSLCWQGGDAPYAVGLSQVGKGPLVGLSGVGTNEVGYGVVDIEPGSYGITVNDRSGAQAGGTFTAVPASQIPGGDFAPGDALAQADALLAKGSAFDYEAYLRLKALNAKDAETQHVLDQICHRAGEQAYPPGPAVAFRNVELVLSNEIATVDDSDPALVDPVFAYLTKAGTFFSEVSDVYASQSHTTALVQGKLTSTSSVTNQTMGMLAYGVTDDWTLGAELPWLTSDVTKTNSGSVQTSGWQDPTYFTVYRVMAQGRYPGTLFLQSSYSPVDVEGEKSAFDFGAAFVRWEDRFAIAAVVDATYVGHLTAPNAIRDPYWRGDATVTAYVPIGERWGASLSLTDRLPFDEPTSSIMNGSGFLDYQNRIFVSPALAFQLVPDKLVVWLNYEHKFDSTYTNTTGPNIAKFGGADYFGIVLTSTALSDAIADVLH